jgi:hypothetical protein
MREVKYRINYGGYLGAEDEYYIDVPDDATEEEIEDAIEEDFVEQIRDNCYWERVNDDEDD